MDTSEQVTLIAKVRERSVAVPRQRRSIADKRRMVEETLVEGASVARVARAHGVNANQVFGWRRLLAHVLVSKYCDHLPLYRQSEIYGRQDVELERSTLADWVGGSAQLLEPLVAGSR
jgi:transposase